MGCRGRGRRGSAAVDTAGGLATTVGAGPSSFTGESPDWTYQSGDVEFSSLSRHRGGRADHRSISAEKARKEQAEEGRNKRGNQAKARRAGREWKAGATGAASSGASLFGSTPLTIASQAVGQTAAAGSAAAAMSNALGAAAYGVGLPFQVASTARTFRKLHHQRGRKARLEETVGKHRRANVTNAQTDIDTQQKAITRREKKRDKLEADLVTAKAHKAALRAEATPRPTHAKELTDIQGEIAKLVTAARANGQRCTAIWLPRGCGRKVSTSNRGRPRRVKSSRSSRRRSVTSAPR